MSSIILKKGPESNRGSLSLQTGEVIFTTDTRRLYIGSPSATTGKEITFGQLSASFVSASVVNATEITASGIYTTNFNADFVSMSANDMTVIGAIHGTSSWSQNSLVAATASYMLGSISSASYSAYSATASYISGSGQNVALGDLLVTDTSTTTWAGLQSHTGSGLFLQRSGQTARVSLLSAGSISAGNAAVNLSVAAGTLGSIQPTLLGHYGAWQLQTFGGSTWTTPARILMQTSGDHNEGSRPTDIILQSTPSGSVTPVTRLKANGTGVQVTGSLGISNDLRFSDGTSMTSATVVSSSYAMSSSYASNANTLDGLHSSSFAPASHTQAVSTISDSTTVGQNVVKLVNPSAVTFIRINADNTISTLASGSFRVAILPPLTGNGAKVLAVNTGTTDVEWVTATAGTADTGLQNHFLLMGA